MSSSAGSSGQGQGQDAAIAAGRKSELDPGSLVNGIYRLVRLVGMGGMGEVWEARHERTTGRVALKLLLPEMGRHEDVLLRFQREVEITSRLNHPNIVRVSDADKLSNGRPFLVMEFLEGYDLAKVTGRPMVVSEVTEIIEQTAMGLHAAHEQSIIHRDLKPANIFVVPLPGTARALIKILDFGISKALDGLGKLTQTHSVMGTPFYMAPEQARGGIASMDARADQFSLAAIAYELLTGRMPFAGDGTMNVLYKVVVEQPPAFASLGISVAPEVEAVVLRGMSKSAEARFASVLEFSDALKAAWDPRAGKDRGIERGGAGRTPGIGWAAEVSPLGFAPPGGTLAMPRGAAATAERAGRGRAPATPRTFRMRENPETTLRGSTGEFAVAADRVPAGGKRRTLGWVIGAAGVAAIVLAVVVLRGWPTRSDRATREPASAEEIAGSSAQRPAAPSAPAAPAAVQVPSEPVPVARRVVVPAPEPSVAPSPTASHPAPSREKARGAKAVMRSKAYRGKATGTARTTGPDAQDDLPAAKPPVEKTGRQPGPERQPGPFNSDL